MEHLVRLYRTMYEHTKDECAQCRCPHSCCSPEYCEGAIIYAQEQWGVTLVRTNHPRLPLMGPTGCTADPHLRPICTLHTCAVNGLGFKPGDDVWTEKYFAIRDEIETAEYERMKDED